MGRAGAVRDDGDGAGRTCVALGLALLGDERPHLRPRSGRPYGRVVPLPRRLAAGCGGGGPGGIPAAVLLVADEGRAERRHLPVRDRAALAPAAGALGGAGEGRRTLVAGRA